MHRSHVQTPHFVLDGCCKVVELAPLSKMAYIWRILGHGLGMGQGGGPAQKFSPKLRLFKDFFRRFEAVLGLISA